MSYQILIPKNPNSIIFQDYKFRFFYDETFIENHFELMNDSKYALEWLNFTNAKVNLWKIDDFTKFSKIIVKDDNNTYCFNIMSITFNSADKSNITLNLELDILFEMSKINGWELNGNVKQTTLKHITYDEDTQEVNNSSLIVKEGFNVSKYFSEVQYNKYDVQGYKVFKGFSDITFGFFVAGPIDYSPNGSTFSSYTFTFSDGYMITSYINSSSGDETNYDLTNNLAYEKVQITPVAVNQQAISSDTWKDYIITVLDLAYSSYFVRMDSCIFSLESWFDNNILGSPTDREKCLWNYLYNDNASGLLSSDNLVKNYYPTLRSTMIGGQIILNKGVSSSGDYPWILDYSAGFMPNLNIYNDGTDVYPSAGEESENGYYIPSIPIWFRDESGLIATFRNSEGTKEFRTTNPNIVCVVLGRNNGSSNFKITIMGILYKNGNFRQGNFSWSYLDNENWEKELFPETTTILNIVKNDYSSTYSIQDIYAGLQFSTTNVLWPIWRIFCFNTPAQIYGFNDYYLKCIPASDENGVTSQSVVSTKKEKYITNLICDQFEVSLKGDKYYNFKIHNTEEFVDIMVSSPSANFKIENWSIYQHNNILSLNFYEYPTLQTHSILKIVFNQYDSSLEDFVESKNYMISEPQSSMEIKSTAWFDYLYSNASSYQVAKSYTSSMLDLTRQQNQMNTASSIMSLVSSIASAPLTALSGAASGVKTGIGAGAGAALGGLSAATSIASSGLDIAATQLQNKVSLLSAENAVNQINAQKSDASRQATLDYSAVDYNNALINKTFAITNGLHFVLYKPIEQDIENYEKFFFMYGWKIGNSYTLEQDQFTRDFEYLEMDNIIYQEVPVIYQSELSDLLKNGVWVFNNQNDYNEINSLYKLNGWEE